MTREEQIAFKADSIADECIAHGAPLKDYYHGFIEGAKWAYANLSQPSLPSNLDEAAQKVEDYYDVGEEHGYLYCHRGDIKDAFKAGAEWMAGQGETIDGEITTTSDKGWEVIRIPKKLYPLGTKVSVQIRKKQ